MLAVAHAAVNAYSRSGVWQHKVLCWPFQQVPAHHTPTHPAHTPSHTPCAHPLRTRLLQAQVLKMAALLMQHEGIQKAENTGMADGLAAAEADFEAGGGAAGLGLRWASSCQWALDLEACQVQCTRR